MYEYKVVECTGAGNVASALNAHALLGWRLVSTYQPEHRESGGAIPVCLILERPKV